MKKRFLIAVVFIVLMLGCNFDDSHTVKPLETQHNVFIDTKDNVNVNEPYIYNHTSRSYDAHSVENADNHQNGNQDINDKHQMRIRIGPGEKLGIPPFPTVNNNGLTVSVYYNGNPQQTVHANMNTSKGNIFCDAWYDLPNDIKGPNITIDIIVTDESKWCGLNKNKVRVEKYLQDGMQFNFVKKLRAIKSMTPNKVLCFIQRQEFVEIYYATNLDAGLLEIQYFSIRGYGNHNGDPVYVSNYYKFENGADPNQKSTGWGAENTNGTILNHLTTWKNALLASDGYVHGYFKLNSNEIGDLYDRLHSVAVNAGDYTDAFVGITFPQIPNNVSDDIIDLDTILARLE